MAFTFELASFTVQDGHEAALLADRPAMINALEQTFPGLLGESHGVQHVEVADQRLFAPMIDQASAR